MRTLRAVGRFGASRWYLGRTVRGKTCLFIVTTSIGSGCHTTSKKFKWGTYTTPVGGGMQLTGILLPDAYDGVRVVEGTAEELRQPRYNLAFVKDDQPLTVEVTGEGGPTRRIPLH